jgi:hypothetical protein
MASANTGRISVKYMSASAGAIDDPFHFRIAERYAGLVVVRDLFRADP